jgi:hypothetical protein
VAVGGDGEVDGDAVDEAAGAVGEVEAGEAAGFETASCAVTILVIKKIAPNAIGILFMKVVCRFVFKVLVIGCGVRIYSNASRKGRICTNATENQAKRPNDLLRARRG